MAVSYRGKDLKIYCDYDQELDSFLKEIVNQLLKKYGTELNLSTLKEIELVAKEKLLYGSDGKVLSNRKIVVGSRLYELLPSLNIGELKDNNNYKMLRQTLYHEMGHINDMIKMPCLYNSVLQGYESNNFDVNCISSLFWLEYIAEKRSASFENVNDFEICDEIVSRKWICTMANPYSNFNESNFFYLTKLLPYFMARTAEKHIREKYMDTIRNKLLVKYIEEIDVEIKHLETIGIFDDPILLNSLYSVINKYYKIFMNTYRR